MDQNPSNDDQNKITEETIIKQNILEKNLSSESEISHKEKKKNKIFLIILVVLIVIGIATFIYLMINDKIKNNDNSDNGLKTEIKKSAYWISSNSLENFDLRFLQLENKEENKIYSPLSIKYALKMLEEATEGEAKSQILSVIGDYQTNKYTNSTNMSFANAIFINDKYKETFKDSYNTLLMEKYNAGVYFDSFSSPDNVNNWISDKTLGLMKNMYSDISQEQFLLVNALAIDMEWEEKFLSDYLFANYWHEDFNWYDYPCIKRGTFEKIDQDISVMKIIASFNNYDIVNVLGEENIRNTVEKDYREYLKTFEVEKDDELIKEFLDKYIEEINSNYKREDKNVDFSLYVDDNVKVFAKDLKEYDGTTLQYVGIMPTNEDLTTYINNISVNDINYLLTHLKELKAENFKDGVVTKITGFIPKFQFEYQLDFINDLKNLGITDVFEMGKANLTNLSSDSSLYINEATHKSNIDFNQDGITASSICNFAGAGGDSPYFDYIYDVPVEEIDLTFDKPYMFLIRDKNTKEAWFVGTVYNPVLLSEDTSIGQYCQWNSRH